MKSKNYNKKDIDDLMREIKTNALNSLAPNFRKEVLGAADIDNILSKIATDLLITKAEALAGVILLMLKGAASTGTPSSLSVDIRGGKSIAKKNIMEAYVIITGNNYIRRLAEALAVSIGEFAEYYGLHGELAPRINTILKAQVGESLTPKESAWCSSFSQNIPDLAIRSSERLVKLLAEDYKKRFEYKKQSYKEFAISKFKKR